MRIMRFEESNRLTGFDGRENFADERLHDALVGLVWTIDIKKLESGPLPGRRVAASDVIYHSAIDNVLAPAVGIQRVQRRKSSRALLVAEAGAAIAVRGSRRGVDQPCCICRAPVPEIQGEADVGRHEFVDVF